MESALSGYGTVLDRDTVRLRVCQFDLRVLIHRRINRKRLTMVLADADADADMHHPRCATVFVFSRSVFSLLDMQWSATSVFFIAVLSLCESMSMVEASAKPIIGFSIQSESRRVGSIP